METYTDLITREMLGKIRTSLNENKQKRKETINEGFMDRSVGDRNGNEFPINEKTPQFGDIRKSQEEALRKTLGESLDFEDNALVYYPDDKFIVLNAMIVSKNVAFQFKFPDSSGDGCYVWSNGLQLTDENSRMLGKLRDAFINWKQNLVNNGDLMKKIHQAAVKGKED